MAASMAMAMAAVEDSGAFEPANGAARPWPDPAPSVGTTEELGRLFGTLAPKVARFHEYIPDAEEAMQDCLLEALEAEHPLFQMPPSTWGGYILVHGRFALRRVLRRRQEEDLRRGVALFSLQDLPVADDKQPARELQQTETRTPARNPERRPPGKGNHAKWTDGEIVGAIREWGQENGRPPTVRDAKKENGLPDAATAKRAFGSWSKALAAAGYRPRPHRKRWTDVEAATALFAHFRRTGAWPNAAELTYVAELPTPGVCGRIFGSHTLRAMIEGVHRILADPAAAEAAERERQTQKQAGKVRAFALRVREWKEKEGHWPAEKDFRRAGSGLPTARTARNVVGSCDRSSVAEFVQRTLATLEAT